MAEKIRETRGLTQKQVVSETEGITRSGYANIEGGTRRPSVAVAKRIAAVRGFEWTRFFEDEGLTSGRKKGGGRVTEKEQEIQKVYVDDPLIRLELLQCRRISIVAMVLEVAALVIAIAAIAMR